MEIADLSFVADRDGKTLPKYTKDQLPRCFWHVASTGDYEEDNRIGYRLAMEYLRFEDSRGRGDHPIIFANIVNDMPRPITGVEVGFLSIIGLAAPYGITRAEGILRHWGMNPSEWIAGSPAAQQAGSGVQS